MDIDDLSANSRDSYIRLICVAYLTGIYGQPLAAPNFDRLLVDRGHARLENFTNNEFDLQDWWSGHRLQAGAEPSQGLWQDLQQNLTKDLLPPVAGVDRKGARSGNKSGLGLAERADRGMGFQE